MSQGKWPSFLFTIGVRFICGTILGGLISLLFTWKGLLRQFSHNDARGAFVWLGFCGVIGGIVAVVTVPRWQRPWYRRESDVLDLVPDEDWIARGSPRIKESVTIKTTDEQGNQHVYSSLEQVPPEIRSEIEALKKEAIHGQGNELSVTENSQMGNAIVSNSIHRKNATVYKIIDESGVEHIYDSLEEMPPEIRAAIADARKIPGNEKDTS